MSNDKQTKDTSMYYNPDDTLSRNRLFNFVVGPRGAGKTYGAKKRAIKNFIDKGEQFVYLRRYDTEMPQSQMRNFFDDIMEEFPDHEFKADRGLFRIDKEIAGWYFPLSKAVMLKSVPFPHVSLIIFDEFIIGAGAYRYLQNEVVTFLEAYSTISRDRDIPVLFLSNAVTFANPYFLYFNITLEKGQKRKLKKDIQLELVSNPAYISHAKQTRFGKLVEGTEYGSYAMDNEFLLDTESFIGNLLFLRDHSFNRRLQSRCLQGHEFRHLLPIGKNRRDTQNQYITVYYRPQQHNHTSYKKQHNYKRNNGCFL